MSIIKKGQPLVDQEKVEELLSKIKKAQVGNKLDLSSGEDLSIAVMNLISIEEHMFFTATKTEQIKYLDLLNEARLMRTKLMKMLIKEYEGEVWCLSKHLLAATMRVNEVGTKALKNGEKGKAWELFKLAYQLYSLFWGLNLGLVDGKKVKNSAEMNFKENDYFDSEKVSKGKTGLLNKLGALVKKAVDCCIE